MRAMHAMHAMPAPGAPGSIAGWLLAAVEEGRWVPGIGDPSAMGWLTVAAYLVAAALSVAWAAVPGRGRGMPIAFAAMLLLLAVNKQLDLQSWMTFEARGLLRQLDLYPHRRTLQVLFIATVAAAAVAGIAIASVAVRRRRAECGIAFAGAILLAGFILVRAASFHRVDHGLGQTLLGWKLNWILELGGIAVFAVGAVIGRRHRLAAGSRSSVRSPWRVLAER